MIDPKKHPTVADRDINAGGVGVDSPAPTVVHTDPLQGDAHPAAVLLGGMAAGEHAEAERRYSALVRRLEPITDAADIPDADRAELAALRRALRLTPADIQGHIAALRNERALVESLREQDDFLSSVRTIPEITREKDVNDEAVKAAKDAHAVKDHELSMELQRRVHAEAGREQTVASLARLRGDDTNRPLFLPGT